MRVLEPLVDKDFSKTIVGITGGIASGKSTVANYLSQTKGVSILDADLLARVAVDPGTPGLAAIQARFGPDVLLESGELNRGSLAEIIFNNPEARHWLENLIHPVVRKQLIVQADQFLKQESRIVMVIPLLFEAQMTDLVDQVWVVTVSEAVQCQRLMGRNHLTVAQAQARIRSQMPLAEKVQLADVVLDNNGPLAELVPQIDQAWENLITSK